MRLTRVFVAAPLAAGVRVTLPPDAAAHLTRVLRLGAGDECIVFDGRGGEYAARIVAAGRGGTLLDVGAHHPVERESPLRVLLLQGLARGERMDLVVQKCTELGVAAIRPVHTRHSGVRLEPGQAERKLAHWRAVAIGACEQARRNRVPEVLQPLPLAEAVQRAPGGARLILSLDPSAAATSPARLAALGGGPGWITLLVGPEGGFAPEEETLAREAGFTALELGPRVLRTETAGMVALAVLGALAGDLAGDLAPSVKA